MRAKRPMAEENSCPKVSQRACSICCLLMPLATMLQPWRPCCKQIRLLGRLQSSGGSEQASWQAQEWT